MKYFLDHKEVTAAEFERARKNHFDGHSQYCVELEEHEIDLRDRPWLEGITLALCGALVLYGLYQLWAFLRTVPL